MKMRDSSEDHEYQEVKPLSMGVPGLNLMNIKPEGKVSLFDDEDE